MKRKHPDDNRHLECTCMESEDMDAKLQGDRKLKTRLDLLEIWLLRDLAKMVLEYTEPVFKNQERFSREDYGSSLIATSRHELLIATRKALILDQGLTPEILMRGQGIRAAHTGLVPRCMAMDEKCVFLSCYGGSEYHAISLDSMERVRVDFSRLPKGALAMATHRTSDFLFVHTSNGVFRWNKTIHQVDPFHVEEYDHDTKIKMEMDPGRLFVLVRHTSCLTIFHADTGSVLSRLMLYHLQPTATSLVVLGDEIYLHGQDQTLFCIWLPTQRVIREWKCQATCIVYLTHGMWIQTGTPDNRLRGLL